MQQTPTRVAILATSEKTQQRLSALLKDAGLNVVAHELPNDGFLQQLKNSSPDVLLVDLSEENGSETDIIDTLLDYDELPIFFNDSSPAGGGANALWAKKLARKLSDVASRHETVSKPIAPEAVEPTPAECAATLSLPEDITLEESTFSQDAEVSLVFESEENIHTSTDVEPSINEMDISVPDVETPTAEEPIVEKIELTLEPAENTIDATRDTPVVANKPEGAAINTWVLGASLGGPQAVRQFLAAIEADLPVAFVLAQHIGANHISLLAEQLNRVTPFTVISGRAGHLIRHHEVILTPADKDIRITEDGYLSLIPAKENAIYSPSIDNVISAVARHYGNMAGTIVFSGMGDDGAKGCEAMSQHGGIIWAQDVDSCVISSMPDQARKTNTVTFSANPRALAERLYDYYRD